MTRMSFFTIAIFFILQFILHAQTEDTRFEVFVRQANGTGLSGATVKIVHMATNDTTVLGEVPSRAGWYRYDNVPFGKYKILVNDAVITTDRFHATNRLYDTIVQIDPDGNLQIDNQGYEDGSITAGKIAGGNVVKSLNNLNDHVVLKAGTNVSIASNGSDTLTISSTGGVSGGGDITAVYAGSGLSGGGTLGDVTIYIGTEQITGTMIADEAIDTRMIAPAAVGTTQISSITSADIPAGTIEESDLANGSVTNSKMADASVGTSKLQVNSVNSTIIVDGSIANADLGSQIITNPKIAPNAIDSTQIAGRQISSSELDDNVVIDRTMGDGVAVRAINTLQDTLTLAAGSGISVTSNSVDTLIISIPNDGVTNAMLGGDVVTTDKIVDGEVYGNDIADDAIVSSHIVSGQVVKSLNTRKDDVRIVAGENVTVTTAGDSISIAATGGGGGGDITAVTASTGLSGGGTSGDVSLQIATEGVTVDMLDSGALPALLQYKNPGAIQLAACDSLGFVVALREVDNGNGGGLFEYGDSLAIRSLYGSAIMTAGISYRSAVPGRRWFRLDALNRKPVITYWFGAAGDGVTDDNGAVHSALATAHALDVPWDIGNGIFRYTTTPTVSLEWGESILIFGRGSNRLNIYVRSQLYPDGCNGLKIINSTSSSHGIELKDFTFGRDTTTIARSDTGIVVEYSVNAILDRVRAYGFEVGGSFSDCGQLKLRNCGASYNTKGWIQDGHSDGIQFEGGFVSLNDELGVSLDFAAGFVVQGTEISHQPIAMKIVNNSTGVIIGGRYENADSTIFDIGASCHLSVYNSSFLPGAGDQIIARLVSGESSLQFYDPKFAGTFLSSQTDTSVIIGSIANNYVSLLEHRKNNTTASEIRVYENNLGLRFIPGPFQQVSSHSAPTANYKVAGQIWQGQYRTGFGPTYLGFVQQMDANTYFFNRLTDNSDIRYGANNDSSGTRLDRIRTRKIRSSVTLSSSAPFTRDTIYVDKFVSNTEYEVDASPMFNTDSSLSIKLISRNANTGAIISSIYHKGVAGVSGTIYYTITYVAKSWDY